MKMSAEIYVGQLFLHFEAWYLQEIEALVKNGLF
jgi:hypothetical protein